VFLPGANRKDSTALKCFLLWASTTRLLDDQSSYLRSLCYKRALCIKLCTKGEIEKRDMGKHFWRIRCALAITMGDGYMPGVQVGDYHLHVL
jgi:hypothetical protein